MSFTPHSANVSRRRQRNRRIVDSTPPPELSQASLSVPTRNGTLADEQETQQQYLDEAFSQVLEEELYVDDPQVDWRTQDPLLLDSGDEEEEEEDNGSDHALDADSTRVVGYEVPEVLRRIEDDSIEMRNPAIHERYSSFLSILCRETSTGYAEIHTLAGLPHVVRKIRSINIGTHMGDDENLDIYAYALVIHTWQLICQWIHHSICSDDGSLSTMWGAYFLSAHSIVQPLRVVCRQELKFAVEHWEERLQKVGGRSSWLIANIFRGVPDTGVYVSQFRNETAVQYIEALQHGGKLGLALLMLDKAAEGPRTPLKDRIKDLGFKRWAFGEIVEMLASMDIDLLTAIIEGQVSRKAEIPFQEVYQALEKINQCQPIQPGTYMNSICDAMGISPTPRQWHEVCNLMLQYIQKDHEHDSMAAELDQLVSPSTRWHKGLANRGLRRYTEWKSFLDNDDIYPCNPHREMIAYFVDQMKIRLKEDTRLRGSDTPLIAAVVEIGFGIDPKRRLRDHRRHRNSNYIMNLAQATFEYAFPGMFRLHQKVIYACWRQSHPWFSEILLTQIGQGYTEGAAGFSHYPAGRSNGTAYRKTSGEEWTKFTSAALRDGHLINNIRDMAKASEARYQMQEKEREEEAAAAKAKEEWLIKFAEVVEAATAWLNEEARLKEAREGSSIQGGKGVN